MEALAAPDRFVIFEGGSMDNSDKIKLAYDMLKHEHTRWNQWAIFFLGSIASIFFVGKSIVFGSTSIPMYILTALSSLVSFFWILAALAIKRSTLGWHKTIIEIEARNQGKPFNLMEIFKRNSNCSAFDGKWKFRSVTNMLFLFGCMSFIFFLIVTIFLICQPNK